jgi:hypothetical protein
MRVRSSTDLWARVRAEWRIKLGLLVGLTTGFCAIYLYLGHHVWFPVRRVPMTFVDRWAGFDRRWVWVYQSAYLLTSTLPWLATTREQLRRYVVGFSLLVSVCFACYLFLPTRVPRPPAGAGGGMYRLLLMYDGPFNAFPSLHGGFLYLTIAFAWRVYGRPRAAIVGLIAAWSVLILWSTLEIREHYAVDLVSGVALAALCDWAAWRSSRRTVCEKSHGGSR